MHIRGILLDVNETLFSMDPVADRFEEVGLARRHLPVWFALVLRDGFALAATREVASFSAIGRYHLRRLLTAEGLHAGDEVVSRALGGFEEVTPHPHVAEGLDAAHRAGLSVATLTNGSASITDAFLDRAGLGHLVDATLEARGSGVWKPHRDSYRWAAEQLGHAPGELLLVAVHPWDVHGAICAGLVGGWLDRDGGVYPQHFRAPDVRAATLAGVIAAAGGQPPAG